MTEQRNWKGVAYLFASLALVVSLLFIVGIYWYNAHPKQQQVVVHKPDVNRMLLANARYVLVESECPKGFVEVKNNSSKKNILIPTGTFVIENTEPGEKEYHLCTKLSH